MSIATRRSDESQKESIRPTVRGGERHALRGKEEVLPHLLTATVMSRMQSSLSPTLLSTTRITLISRIATGVPVLRQNAYDEKQGGYPASTCVVAEV